MNKKISFLCLSIAALSTSIQSCKQPDAPKGSIKVVIDSSGAVAPNTSIHVTSVGSKGRTNLEGIDKVITTNTYGTADIEVKLDAVVQCYATKATGKAAPYDTLRGVKSLQLSKDKKNFVDTVTIRLRY
ncbi:MAG: hypothetical protein H7331_05770 [Bacteroidia bacterium]|nr:hypothetical protein [Bacteroidia bacterium]